MNGLCLFNRHCLWEIDRKLHYPIASYHDPLVWPTCLSVLSIYLLFILLKPFTKFHLPTPMFLQLCRSTSEVFTNVAFYYVILHCELLGNLCWSLKKRGGDRFMTPTAVGGQGEECKERNKISTTSLTLCEAMKSPSISTAPSILTPCHWSRPYFEVCE